MAIEGADSLGPPVGPDIDGEADRADVQVEQHIDRPLGEGQRLVWKGTFQINPL